MTGHPDDVERSARLLAVLTTVLELTPEGPPLTWGSDLGGLGLDSLTTVETVLQLEEAFDVELPDEALAPATFATPLTLWGAVERAIADADGALS
ncbi:acyl carrier protein [Clavibacter michiganensis]|uniref:phosphopantetheine-binding protein n=1 Tax=Clavibacter michiganensis TaxID=28447 RepID=UPI00195D9707|nr:phosphopantetheine-binding protein [Clavibacter michiganensis]MBM7411569.1 acyl carrier protein [Clavibacter michiganensis]